MKINIKPLSVNDAWKGRRFKSNKYKAYELELWHKLPALKIPKGIKLELTIKVGFSSKGSDLDNICKPFQDVISKKYNFNDNQIYRLIMNKKIVKKGYEFIYFELKEWNINNI